ncbi:MAG: vanadium-dependent haloperoxidase [Acidobacteriota bacterium]
MESRKQQALDVRRAAAELAHDRSHPHHCNNGEEFLYRRKDDDKRPPSYVASFTKGLPHDESGLLWTPPGSEDPFTLFVLSIQSGNADDFRRTPLGPPKYFGMADSATVDYAGLWESAMAKRHQRMMDLTPGARLRAWESAGAGHVFDLQGPDAQAVTMPPAPRLDEPELIAEIAEVYIMALLRDVPFSRFRAGAKNDRAGKLVQEAFTFLNGLDWFKRIMRSDLDPPARLRHRTIIQADTLFRGFTAGDEAGPYLSQFLVVGSGHLGGGATPADGLIRYGAIRIDQRVRTATPKKDYMTTWEQWLDVQNGADLREAETYVPVPKTKEEVEKAKNLPPFRLIATPRDLATYVHYDALYQAYLNACLLMLALEIPFDRGIPFQASDAVDRQQGFAHFGGPHILTLVTEVATRALKAVRYQKFNVHRRARPEALCGLIHRHRTDTKDLNYGDFASILAELDRKDLKFDGKPLLEQIADHNAKLNTLDDRKDDASANERSYLLPMAFAEGSPMHPSYGAGHATVAGACVTVLKAYFDHGFPLTHRLGGVAWEPDDRGRRLRKVEIGTPLTVEGELNKLAANISIGRDWAGVHYYTDYIESIRMGEEIAVGMLEEQKLTYSENFTMTLPLFSGEVIRI